MNQRLIIAAVVMMIAVVSASDIDERGAGQLASVMKKLGQIENRLKQIESNRMLMLKGRDGGDGAAGRPGPRGYQGPSGKHGARGPPGRSGGGVQYIRWGKTSCPAGADLVYKGRIGGGRQNYPGSGSNYICLPKTPKYLNYKPGHQDGAAVYGTEYEVYRSNPFSKSNLHDHDAPCVACHVKTRSSKLMIPAIYDCPSGWTREYYGYLMAGHNAQKHSAEYICVDRDPEVVPGSKADRDGALLYPVEGICGSLPCSPYVEGRELTCVVCTK